MANFDPWQPDQGPPDQAAGPPQVSPQIGAGDKYFDPWVGDWVQPESQHSPIGAIAPGGSQSDVTAFNPQEGPLGGTENALIGPALHGFQQGLGQWGRSFGTAAGEAPTAPTPPSGAESQAMELSDLWPTHWGQLWNKTTYGFGENAIPIAAAFVADAMGGGPAGPGHWAFAPAVYGVATAAQNFGDTYAREQQTNPDGALKRAFMRSVAQGITAGLSWAAFGQIHARMPSKLGETALQPLVQGAIGAGSQVAQNAITMEEQPGSDQALLTGAGAAGLRGVAATIPIAAAQLGARELGELGARGARRITGREAPQDLIRPPANQGEVTADDMFDAAHQQFQQVHQMGVSLKPETVNQWADNATTALKEAGYNQDSAGPVFRRINELKTDQATTLPEISSWLTGLRATARGQSAIKTSLTDAARRARMAVMDGMDHLGDNDAASGQENMAAAVPMLKDARSTWHYASMMDDLDTAVEDKMIRATGRDRPLTEGQAIREVATDQLTGSKSAKAAQQKSGLAPYRSDLRSISQPSPTRSALTTAARWTIPRFISEQALPPEWSRAIPWFMDQGALAKWNQLHTKMVAQSPLGKSLPPAPRPFPMLPPPPGMLQAPQQSEEGQGFRSGGRKVIRTALAVARRGH